MVLLTVDEARFRIGAEAPVPIPDLGSSYVRIAPAEVMAVADRLGPKIKFITNVPEPPTKEDT